MTIKLLGYVPIHFQRRIEDALWEYLCRAEVDGKERGVATVPVMFVDGGYAVAHPSFIESDRVAVWEIVKKVRRASS